jgi:hypothetical protein
MDPKAFDKIFTQDVLNGLFPAERADQFFEALFGDAQEGAYDISLGFKGYDRKKNRLLFEFQLNQRPGKCLACSLTYGLPEVFSRHPVIAMKALMQAINTLLDGQARCEGWSLGNTRPASERLHLIPLSLNLGRL